MLERDQHLVVDFRNSRREPTRSDRDASPFRDGLINRWQPDTDPSLPLGSRVSTTTPMTTPLISATGFSCLD